MSPNPRYMRNLNLVELDTTERVSLHSLKGLRLKLVKSLCESTFVYECAFCWIYVQNDVIVVFYIYHAGSPHSTAFSTYGEKFLMLT